VTHQTGPATSTTKIIWNGIPDLISVVPYPSMSSGIIVAYMERSMPEWVTVTVDLLANLD
jgi:hypothetical protein